MGNLYTGSALEDIWKHCLADYRFFAGGDLRNHRPGLGAGGGIGDLGYTDAYYTQGNTSPWDSVVAGVPCVTIDHDSGYFPFPANLAADILFSQAAFTIEILTFPDAREIANTYMALVGELNANTPYCGLREDNRIELNWGTQLISNQVTWWWKGHPLHFVVGRDSGERPDSYAWVNGVLVDFGADPFAGNGGFTTGYVFNHTSVGGNLHPFYGHHLFLRFYDSRLTAADVYYLYKRARRVLPHHLFRLPIYSAA